jgi:hypothetical protein
MWRYLCTVRYLVKLISDILYWNMAEISIYLPQCLVRKLDLHRCPIKVPYFVTFQRYIVIFCCNQCSGWSATSAKPWEHESPDPVALKHWLAGVFYWLARHTWRQPPRYSHSQTSCCVLAPLISLCVFSVLSALHGSHPCTQSTR